MIYLGPMMFFRREKYRFVLVLISFLAFDFSTIIAIVETLCVSGRGYEFRSTQFFNSLRTLLFHFLI